MFRTTIMAAAAAALVATSGPGLAASKKETDCTHQAAVVAAVQKARLDRVRERQVKETVLAGEVTWPERYNAAIPLFTAEVYKLKMKDVKNTDISAQWMDVCMAN
ncbi:hypothetical protein [Sulfitobacter aestuariivivens]|uniref:Uncharacterized protein n=1 Tax=Sulfitobacter aestuariivivens TaxID=2766981 RepID=A0A927D3C8_9RHOB|nr:hypothetical protein [Sulfitobacter aestuariivivens]MBD3662517.1 hypothetical protein [Sulfitobacter aestuariivivens]